MRVPLCKMRIVRFIIMAVFLGVATGATAQMGCVPVTLPWSEDFDSCGTGATRMPPCWSATHNYDIGAVPHVDTTVHYNGTASLMLYSGSLTGSHYSMAIGPEAAEELSDGIFARFRYYALTTSVALEVGICDDTNRYTRNFVPLDTIYADQGRRWKEVVVDLSSYNGTGRRIAFRLQRGLQTGPSQCYIDNLRLEGCGATQPRAYHIGHNSLTVDWDHFGTGAIELEYNGLTMSNAEAPLTLTDLTPQTEYTFSIGCEGNTRQEITVTTLPAPSLQTTYYEPFSQTTLPAGWLTPMNRIPTVSQGRLTMTVAGDSCLAVLPLPLEDINLSTLAMALHLQGDTSTRLVAGVMTYGLESESFVPLTTWQPNGGWQLKNTDFASYSGTGRYLALMATGTGTVKVDNLRVARCLLDSLLLYDLTDVSVTLAWDTLALTNGATVTIEYGAPGFAEGTGTLVTATSNPFVLNGLAPATNYDLLVTPSCGDLPCAFDRHSITTFSHEVSAPYCVDFEESEALPMGWVCGQGTATIGTTAYQGSHGLRLGARSLAALPRIGTAEGDTVILECYSYGTGMLEVGFMANPYGTFTPADTLTGGNGWRRQLATLVIPEGRLLALCSTAACDIDALAVHHDAVTATAVDSIGKTSAHLSWQTLQGSDATLEYNAVASPTDDFIPGTGIPLQGHDSLAINGLTPNTYYTVHLWPTGDSTECVHQTLHFQTAADSVAVPYCENFDLLNNIPADWRRKSDYGEYPIVSTERNHSPSKALRFSATETAKTVALLPDFVSGSEHLMLAFWTNVTLHPEGAMLMVGHLDNIADLESFVPLDTITFSQQDIWENHLIDLGTAHGNVALMLVGGSSDETRLFVDDLCVEHCVANNIRIRADSTSVTVQWDSHGVSELNATVRRGSVTRTETLTSSPAVITGLVANEPYTLTLRSLCDCGDFGGIFGNSSNSTTGSVTGDLSVTYSLNTHPSWLYTPYCNGFEGYSTGYRPFSLSKPRVQVTDRNYHEGGHSLIINDSCYLILSAMNNITTLTMSLYAYASNESGIGNGVIQLGVMTTPDSLSSFTLVDSMSLDRPGEWQRLWGDLASHDGTGHYITLKIIPSDTCTFFIDDLNVSACNIGAVTTDGEGLVSWESLQISDSVIIEYGPQGFPQGSGQRDLTTASSYLLQDYVAVENYDIYLTPHCGTTSSCLATKVTLGVAASTPYCENFDAAPPSGMPSGWTIGRTHSGTPAIANGSSQCLRLQGHSDPSHRSIAVLPLLSAHDTLQLGMSLRSAGGNARLVVGHIADNADPNTFIVTDTLSTTAVNRWQRVTSVIDLPVQRRLAISCLSINQSDAQVWIDTLTVTRGLTPTLSAISARSMAISGVKGFIEYAGAGFQQGEGTLMHVTTDTLFIDNLTPEAEYWVYTREDSSTLTCMPPAKIRMPSEAVLPYCLESNLFTRLQLPEMAIDSIRHLHLYFTLDGPCQVEVGVMGNDGDWDHLSVIDTVTLTSSIRQQIHVSFSDYDGQGRFVGLRSLGGNVALSHLTATACPWTEIEERDDNSVVLKGSGMIEYGPAGFAPGNGTTVTVTDSLTIPLADTTLYDFYPFCPDLDALCSAPLRYQTSMEVDLPYCVPFANKLPDGWTSHSNALDNNAVRVHDGCLEMTAAAGREIAVKGPIMTADDIVVDMEVWLSGTNVTLLLDNMPVGVATGMWQQARVRVSHEGRLTFKATGSGTARIRNLKVSTCTLPLAVDIRQPGGRSVELNWDTAGCDNPFFVEYRLAGSPFGTTVRATEPPLAFQLLPDTSYIFYLKCDSAGISCHEPFNVATLSDPQSVPYCTSFNADNQSVAPEGWYSVREAGANYLVMPQFDIVSLQMLNVLILAQMHHGRQEFTLGVMSDASNPETFDSLTAFVAEESGANRFFHSLVNYHGNGRFLALRINGEGWVRVTHLSVDTCAAYNISMIETEADHITLDWESQGSPTMSVEYGPMGFIAGEGTTITATTPPLRIDGLAPLTDYAFLASHSCGGTSCRPVIVDSFLTFIPKGGSGCIDYTDLHASYVSCKYGSYSNPTEFTGVIDKGYLSATSRHTVHFDSTERDARTGGLLRTVPKGEQASVRLGNWTSNINPQAESITYALTVDTNDFSLLVLRYAAVLQDPEHSAELQPRFRLQILNQNNEIIDNCSAADFIANPALVGSSEGWNIAANDVLWKDWTTVGIDLSTYAGQTIFIRLITNDCGEGSHFGYAYFTLGCSSKRMQSEGCSNVPSNRFTVPLGFNYRWYTNLDTTTLSDSASIMVPSDNSKIYYCQLSFIDNPDCHFTMSAFAGARFPLAIIDTSLTLADCEFDLTLIDHSTISGDGITPVGTGESCETSLWLLPDSTTSNASTLTLHIIDTGSYEIGLVAGIADNQCLDTVHHTIHIAYPYPAVTLEGRNERCFDDPAEVLALAHAALSDWEGHLLELTPLADTTITVSATDSNGCHHSLTHTLVVHPVFFIEDSAAVCSSSLSHTWRDTTLTFTIADTSLSATLNRQTAYGCDSTMTIDLTLWSSYDIHHTDTICDNQTLDFFDTILNTTGNYLHPDTTILGCDSLVTMHLNVMPTYHIPDSLVACDSLRWQDGTLYTADTTGALHVLPTLHGCDSTIELNLSIHPSYHPYYRDSVCNSLDTYVWLDTLLTLDPSLDDITATLVRHTVYSCDSIHTLDLTLMPSYYIRHFDTICHDSQLSFFDTIISSTGEYLHVDSTLFGCDSMVVMQLMVIPRVFSDDNVVACDSTTWVNGTTYYNNISGVIDTLRTLRGCDSVVTLYLTINHSTYDLVQDTFCQGTQYPFRDHLFTEGGYYADTIPTVKGCDSVMAINLIRLSTPQISISYDYDCDSLYYHLAAESDVPYILWTSVPYDSLLDSHENDATLDVNPKTRTVYTLYADHYETPHCPATTTLTLTPATKPVAKIKVSPTALVLPSLNFNAYDISNDYQERAWYVDGVLQAETSRHLEGQASPDRDSLRVTLLLSDGHCIDSVAEVIPLLYSTVVAPNAFTPDRDNNNSFSIQGIGILQGEVRIYNRHGSLVFHSNDFNQPWDGRSLNGDPCPSGYYVWHLRYTSVTRPGAYQEETGTVLLLR